MEQYQIDHFDRKILRLLQKDARTPYLEIARDLNVSGGMIHQRVDRLKALGVIKGSSIEIDESKLGIGIVALVGIHLNRAQDYADTLKVIQKMPEVLEAYYTTGSFALIIKVVAKDMNSFYHFMTERLQRLSGVRSTESFLCLKTPIKRAVSP